MGKIPSSNYCHEQYLIKISKNFNVYYFVYYWLYIVKNVYMYTVCVIRLCGAGWAV